jgi:hypothetical protein
MIRRSSLLGAATIALLGCGPPASEGGSNQPPSFVDAYERAFTTVSCRNFVECPQDRSSGFGYSGRFQSLSQCEAVVGAGLAASLFGDIRRAIDEGRVLLDEDGEAECVRQLQARVAALPACADASDLRVEACEDIVTGTVPESGACILGDECAGEATCLRDACPPGTLNTQPPDYEQGCYTDCADDEGACGAGEECRLFNGGAIGICLPLDGSSPPGPSDACYGQCVPSEPACDGDCPPALGEGDACQPGDDCTRDGRHVGCLEGTCTAFWSSGEGEPCGVEGDFCAPGLDCAFDVSECVAPRPLDLLAGGDSCRPGQDLCELGLTCTGFDTDDPEPVGTCQPARRAGEECFFYLECAGDLTCLGATLDEAAPAPGACGPLREAGEECMADPECRGGRCEGTRCAGEEVCALP